MAFKKPELSTKGKTHFLFVHHDATNLDSRVDAEKVNAHVQLLYRRRKRGVNERWKPNLEAKARQLKLKMRDGTFVAHGRQLRRKQADKDQMSTITQRDGSVSGITMTAFSIQKGNSDPFSAMPIDVGPIINMILSWHSTKGIPALHPVESAILASPTPSARRTWAYTVSSLQDANLVYPHLASVCALMTRRTEHQNLRNVSLQLKDRAYAELRRVLMAPGMMVDFVTRNMILHMFWAELATGAPSAARTHLKMLDSIVRSAAGLELPAECRLKFLAADTNLAVSQLEMPVAGARDRSTEKYFEGWKGLLTGHMNEMVVLKTLGLHASVADRELRTVLMRLRELVAVTELVAQGSIRDSSVFQWMDARLLSCELHLVAVCVEHKQALADQSSLQAGQRTWREHCISLAALAWISSTWASSNRGQGPTMVKRLKEAVLDAGLLDVGSDVPEDLTVWMLYAGAALESRGTRFQPLGTWFSRRLKTKVERAGLAEVTDTLNMFLYSEGVCPLNLWQGEL